MVAFEGLQNDLLSPAKAHLALGAPMLVSLLDPRKAHVNEPSTHDEG